MQLVTANDIVMEDETIPMLQSNYMLNLLV